MKVVFSKRAYIALLSETASKLTVETGGIFLGQKRGDIWYIIETIDPGPNSVFQVAYFEYDQQYVSHLANKIAKLYETSLKLIGLWHRHPGSLSVFSSTDDITNKKYAMLRSDGAISALVNIDPYFRLTMYYVPPNINYTKISYEVNDNFIPSEFLKINDTKFLENILAGKSDKQSETQNIKSINYEKIIIDILRNLKCMEITYHIDFNELLENFSDKDLDAMLSFVDEDIEFICNLSLNFIVKKFKNSLRIINNKNYFEFYITRNYSKCYILYKNKWYIYISKMFIIIVKDIMRVGNQAKVKVTKEFIECSILKLRKN